MCYLFSYDSWPLAVDERLLLSVRFAAIENKKWYTNTTIIFTEQSKHKNIHKKLTGMKKEVHGAEGTKK